MFPMVSIRHLVLCCRSTNTPRAAARKSAAVAAGFSFRLEERAEKRKEVCTILHSGVSMIHILSSFFLFPCTEGP
jgi:hypothetical protein